jgi:hypothetical protein
MIAAFALIATSSEARVRSHLRHHLPYSRAHAHAGVRHWRFEMTDADVVIAPRASGGSFTRDSLPRGATHRFGPIAGELGYSREATGLDSHELSGAAATQLMRPISLVGGKVSMQF